MRILKEKNDAEKAFGGRLNLSLIMRLQFKDRSNWDIRRQIEELEISEFVILDNEIKH